MITPSAGERLVPTGLWVLAMLALTAGEAQAEPAKVLLIPYQPIARQAAPELAAQITKSLAAELGGSDAFSLVTMEAEAPAPETEVVEDVDMDVGKGELGQAQKRLATAERLMKKYRFDQAIRSYQQAIESFEAAAPAVDEIRPIADAYVQLGVAAFRRGKEDLAEEALTQAVILDPERELDPREYPPLLLRIYDDIYRKVLRKPRGAISLDVGVAGAEVLFNGKSVGASPILMKGVPPGRHFVRAVKEGAGVFGQVVEVQPEQTTQVKTDLSGGKAKASTGQGSFVAVAAAVAGNRVDVVTVDAVQAIAKQQGADYAVFGGLRRGEASIPVASYMVSCDSGALVRLIDLDIDLDMLSVSIEAFKLSEDISNNIQSPGPDLGPGPHDIVRGLAASGASASGAGGVAEVDVGPAVPDAGASRVASAEQGDRRPLEGDDGKRSVIDTGDASGARRSSLSDGENALDDRPRETIADIDAPDEWYENVWLWVGVGSGAVLLAAAGTAGVIFWAMTRPPEGIEVQAEWE